MQLIDKKNCILIIALIIGLIVIFGMYKEIKAYNVGCNYTISYGTAQNMVLAGPSGSGYDYWIINDLSGKYCPHPDGMLAKAILPANVSINYNKIVPIANSTFVNNNYGTIQYQNDDEGNDRLNGSFFLTSGLDSGMAYYTNCKICPDSGIGRAEDCEWQKSLTSYLPHFEIATQQFCYPLGGPCYSFYPAMSCGTIMTSNPPEVALPNFNPASSNTMEFWVHDLAGGNIGPVKIFKLYKNPSVPQVVPGSFSTSLTTNGCTSGSTCSRSATVSWSQATGALYYTVEVWKNGVKQGTYTRYDSNRTYNISDDGKNIWAIYVRAVNNAGVTQSSTWPLTVPRCNPTVVFTNAPNCPTSSTPNTMAWRKCFADTSTLTRAECSYIQPTYEFRMKIFYTNARPSENDIKTKLSSIAGLNLANVEIRGDFDIRVKNMVDSTLEQPIKEVLRQLGHYKDDEKNSRIGVPLPTICPIGNCGVATNLLLNSNLITYTDDTDTFNPAVPNRYTVTVRRNVDGATAQVRSDLKACSAIQSGLTIEYDPNITLNPPPGFADLFAPVFQEIVPK